MKKYLLFFIIGFGITLSPLVSNAAGNIWNSDPVGVQVGNQVTNWGSFAHASALTASYNGTDQIYLVYFVGRAGTSTLPYFNIINQNISNLPIATNCNIQDFTVTGVITETCTGGVVSTAGQTTNVGNIFPLISPTLNARIGLTSANLPYYEVGTNSSTMQSDVAALFSSYNPTNLAYTVPEQGTSTTLFDNFYLNVSGIPYSSTDQCQVNLDWHLPLKNQSGFQVVYGKCSDWVANGILVPFVGFPQISNTDIVSLPMTSDAFIWNITQNPSQSEDLISASATVAYNIVSTGNATNTTLIHIQPVLGGGGLTYTISTSTVNNPFIPNAGTQSCSFLATQSIWNISDWWCSINTFIAQTQTQLQKLGQGMVATLFGAVQHIFPLSIIYDFNTDVNTAIAQVNATTTPDISIGGLSDTFGGRTFTFLTPSTTAWISAGAHGLPGWDYKAFVDYILYAMTFGSLAKVSISLLKRMHHNPA